MCDGQYQPSGVTEALRILDRTLDYLNAADAASLPSSVQAEALRALEQASAKHTAARTAVLAAFAGQAAYEDDGQGSAGAWLKWQTRVTTGAAAGAVGWVRRLAAHPAIADALAAGDLSESWARQVCAWTDRLPPASRTMPTRSWLQPPARGWIWPGWQAWRRKCTNAPTATAMASRTGSATGPCGWIPPWVAPAG
jgi:hypothetical protein